MQTRSQMDAASVHAQITRLDPDLHGTYGRLCNRFPVMVLQNGLTQALGFIAGKAGTQGATAKAFGQFGKDVAELLGESGELNAFVGKVLRADLVAYQRLTRRALAVSLWQKRFAESVLGVGPGDEGGSNDASAT